MTLLKDVVISSRGEIFSLGRLAPCRLSPVRLISASGVLLLVRRNVRARMDAEQVR